MRDVARVSSVTTLCDSEGFAQTAERNAMGLRRGTENRSPLCDVRPVGRSVGRAKPRHESDDRLS